MVKFEEIKDTIGMIISTINNSRDLQMIVCEEMRKPRVEDLEIASCNHVFTDRPWLFNIEQNNGAKLRDYIQQYASYVDKEKGPRRYVLEIRENFSDILSDEDPRWLNDHVNKQRIEKGFEPISPSYPK